MGSCVSSCTEGSEQEELRISDSSTDRRSFPMVRTDYNSSRLEYTNASNGQKSSSLHSNNPLTTTTPDNMSHQKRNFYSRIPPLGRSSSDKRNSGSNNSIKLDNNNAYSESKISALFEHYKDPQEDEIGAEGIERLCRDLEVKPEDFKVLILAWKFGAERMCRFTREEFYRGMRELKTDTVKGIQMRLPDITMETLADPQKFKELYRFAFKFGLDIEIGQKVLPTDFAISLWRVVFSHKEPPILDKWIFFLENHPQIRGIPRDTWNMFLNFVESVGSDLSAYDDTEAWPSLFDDFVEWEIDKLNQNISPNNVSLSNEKSSHDPIDQSTIR